MIGRDPDAVDAPRKRRDRQFPGIRPLIGPVTACLDVLDLAWPLERTVRITIVVPPEYVARHWWDRLLYNQSAKRLTAALVGREHTVIAGVPYRRGTQ